MLLASTILRTILFYRLGTQLDSVSGAWAALADDLCRGTFYRPVLGPLGFGGTRAFPLYFTLHALLIRCGMGLTASGYVLSGLSGLLVVGGTCLLLRRLCVPLGLAVLSSLWILAPQGTSRALASFHPDLLAIGLEVCGIAVCLRSQNLRRIMLAGVLFALAFAAKMTAVSAPAAVFLYWITSHKTKAALQLGSVSGFLGAAVLAAMQLASNGRALHILFASGGTSPRWLLLSAISFWQVLLYEPVVAAFVVLAAFLALKQADGPARFATVWFVCSLAVTILIYAAPGAATNHLLELQVAAMLVMGTALARGDRRRLAWMVSALILLASLLNLQGIRHAPNKLANIRQALQAAGTNGPILAENPLLPILAGEQPRVLDPFMLNLLAKQHPEIRTAFNAELEQRRFAAVILDHNRDTPETRRWYATSQFGGDFLQELQANYVRVAAPGPFAVFKPR
ncbi:MAG TPA: hypothetical protein VKT29_02210 [Terriglobales bacterium]|nr:hypothetical protein [Terriglobales bacterium]